MTPFQRGKSLKREFQRKRRTVPSPDEEPTSESPASPFARIRPFRPKDAETRRRGDGAELTGRFTDGRLDGCGVMVFPDGRRYEGEFKAGALEGHGTLFYPSGAVYVGRFRRNKRHGQGDMTFASGFRYEGHFRQGRCHGYGSLYFPDGAVYHGQFENGRFNGRGDLSFPDGARYEGQFRDDRRHGPGTLILPNGFKYDGQFANNRPEGRGEMTYPGGASYVGRLKAGKCHGYGRLVYGNGARYEGEFKEGYYHGQGRLTFPDGTVQEGKFHNDQLQNQGTVARPDGKTGKKQTGKMAVVGKKPEQSVFLLDMDMEDLWLREDEPEKEADLRAPEQPGRKRSRHRTSDGHFVASKEEIIVDNWLYMTGVRHAHGKRLPLEEEIYVTFYLPEGRVCLECRGGSERSEEKERKRRLFKNNHFNLIELRDEDFYNLDDILSQKLLACGIRALEPEPLFRRFHPGNAGVPADPDACPGSRSRSPDSRL